MSVAGVHDAGLEESVVAVYAHERLDDEYHRAEVVGRSLAWTVEEDACIGGQTPVVVLTRAVDAVERFLVEEHLEARACGQPSS